MTWIVGHLLATAIGISLGLIGGGGSILAVPTLVYIIVPLEINLMVSFILAASLGIVVGAYLVKFVQARQLQKGFGYFLLAMAAFIFWQNWDKIQSPQNTSTAVRKVKNQKSKVKSVISSALH
ncbi:MAG: hypothetical protein QNJ63_31955 [Calothrix sp. MO_192.B10]|nr:hypothetical protein [Calothrix sp. MO_192.B10]